MKKKKEYTLIFLDKGDNELTAKRITAFSKKEALKYRDAILLTCQINDCAKIIVK